MRKTNYEIWELSDSQLPFVFHRRQVCKKREFRSNWHEDLELLQCIEGAGFVRCDTEQLPLTPGHVVVANANVLHNVGSAETVACRCLIINNSFFKANHVPISTLHFQEQISDPRVLALMEAIAADYERLEPADYLTVLDIRTHVQQLIHLLCREFTAPKPETASGSYVKKAISFMTKNMAKPLCLEDVAQAVGISKYYLARQFKQFSGKTVVQTLNGIRCAQARQLIRDGMSVSAAAAATGFENLPYFTCVFKKHYNKLPSEYLPRKSKK